MGFARCGHRADKRNTIVRTVRGRSYRSCRTCYNAYHRKYERRLRKATGKSQWARLHRVHPRKGARQ